ncbi:MAG: flavin reductase family protein [Candidatus Bilamarchaeaceae archaeon]
MEKLYYLLYPMRIVLITAKHEKNESIMPAAWCYPLSADPSMFGVSIAKKRFTYELISKSKKFAINIPTPKMKSGIVLCGKTSGRTTDKFAETGWKREEGKIGVPLVSECSASIECVLEKEVETGDHVVLVGRVENIIRRFESKGIYHKGGAEFLEL